ncbi:ATP-binding protein [Geodermatophilus sp. SYSU D01119]
MTGPGPEPAAPIGTPDRRLRVFVSSTLTELAAERAAVRAAVTSLRLTPVMFELGARPHPPRDLYRAYLRQSDVFVGLYGDSYGWVAPGMAVSGIEDEFDLSDGLPRLLYVRDPAPDRDPRLAALVERMQATGGASTVPFSDPARLGEQVADDLAVLLTERFAARPAPGAPVPGLTPGWLPEPPTPLVDRGTELGLLTGLLRAPEVRLVTLTGPGGIGKTRLALAGAAVVRAERDGVWFVDLAPVRDAAGVPVAVAGVLGVRPEGARPLVDVVAERLAGVSALLVLDNAEQVSGVAPVLAALLERCPRLDLLVTSRSVLGLRGETDVPLQPLPVPAPGAPDPAAPAVQLFTARARAADPSFTAEGEDAAAVGELVRRLEGLPLAIELAAARVRVLPPRALLRRLRSALDLRAPVADLPDRQRTLRATLEWSHELLGAEERLVLARLSVCTGGCTLDTAEAVAAVDGDVDVVEALSALVAQSLVAPDDAAGGEPRFRMLDVVRAFAAERLRELREEDAARERLARHLTGVAEAAAAGLAGPDRASWLARLEAEADDLEATLEWAVTADRAELVVGLAAPLARWWWARGRLAAMSELADRTAALPSARRLSPAAAASLRWACGSTAIAMGRPADAVPQLTGLVAEARELGDPWLLAQGLTLLAMTRTPEDPSLRPQLEEAEAAARASGDPWAVAFTLVPLGDVDLLAGDVPAATARHTEALRAARASRDDHLAAAVLDQLGLDALLGGDPDGAAAHLREAAALHRALADREGLANCLEALAGVALLSGRPEEAARLAGSADATRRLLGLRVWPFLRPLAAQLAAAVDAALGPERAAAERAAGARRDGWAALEDALAASG